MRRRDNGASSQDLEETMSQLVFDDDMARQLEAVCRTRDVLRRRQLVRDALDATPGERILDVGSRAGFCAIALLERVGAEGSVVGLSSSAQSDSVRLTPREG
jgi:cyclopropane fatty-acyl-phospholipid synthase-like methyltransferase